MLNCVSRWILTSIIEMLTLPMIVALMMETVSISETSVYIYQPTERNIPEDSHLHIYRRKNQ
jgi:hypothetical protein